MRTNHSHTLLPQSKTFSVRINLARAILLVTIAISHATGKLEASATDEHATQGNLANMEIKPDFLKPSEASLALKISRSKLYEALQRGEIPSVIIAGLKRIPRRWIDEQVRRALEKYAETGDAGEGSR